MLSGDTPVGEEELLLAQPEKQVLNDNTVGGGKRTSC